MADDILETKENCAVQAHISMLQGIISRMADNSAKCKNFTITLVAAMLVLLVDKDMKIPNAWICLIPIVLFYILDCFYLGLEKAFISEQNKFLELLQNGNYADSIFKVEPPKGFWVKLCNTIRGLRSFSTSPFYIIVMIVVFIFGCNAGTNEKVDNDKQKSENVVKTVEKIDGIRIKQINDVKPARQ